MRLVVAGTFGPIHDGHRALFDHALEFGTDGVVVGLTSDQLATETRAEPRPIPSFAERTQAVRDAFDDRDRWGRTVEIRRLESEPGFAVSDPTIDGLVLSPETAPELQAINDQRRDRDLDPLTGIVAPYVLADDGERLSSTRIVRGEVDQHGRLRADSP